MRSAGFLLAALLIAATVSYAQQPVVPGAPVTPQPPAAQPAQDAEKLDAHLAAWEKKMGNLVNFRTEITLKRTDAVFKDKAMNYTGVVLCMKPKYAILRLDRMKDDGKKDEVDYEAYICDGKMLYAYNGINKTVTKVKLTQDQAGVDNLMLDFLAGMKAKEVKERFDINLYKTDEHYIYLDIKPLRPADQREFQHLRMALYGPGPKTANFAYLPAQLLMLKPGGDTEQWKFSNPQIDLPDVKAEHFRYVEIKDKGWTVQEAPPQPMGGGPPPGGGPLPVGGAVRPGRP